MPDAAPKAVATLPGAAVVLTDGAAGNEKQATALCHYLGVDALVHRVSLGGITALLAPHLFRGRLADLSFQPALDPARMPALLVGCGRAGGVALAVLKALRPELRTVQILDPRGRPEHYDLIITPQHDRLRADNVLVSIGALHRVDEAFLAHARREHPELAAAPHPRIAVLFGAPSRHARIDDAYIGEIFARLPADATLWITASRRTPPALVERLRAFAHGRGRIWADLSDGPNPYPGFLALADQIVVTPDSVNMLSEACGTDAPVLVHPPLRLSAKLQRFLAALTASGRVRSLADLERPASPIVPLRETAEIAVQVRRRLGYAGD